MSVLDWSRQGIGDSDLLTKLYDVRNDVQYEVLYLFHNQTDICTGP